MRAKNISGRRIKVEYGFNTIRKKELIDPNQIIEIDEFDYNHLSKFGIWQNGEMILIEENKKPELDKMAQAKADALNYIEKN